MLSFMDASTREAASPARSAGTSKPAARSAANAPGRSSRMKRSPAAGSCQTLASGCQVYAASTGPLPPAQVRTRSGRSEATRAVRMQPQSWPTRSTGSPTRSSRAISQSTYSSLVERKPSGRGAPNPGRSQASTSVRVRWRRTPSHTRWVSGTPWTRMAGIRRAPPSCERGGSVRRGVVRRGVVRGGAVRHGAVRRGVGGRARCAHPAGRGARRWARRASSSAGTSSSMGRPGAHSMVTTNRVRASASALPSW